jgi:hypothetical protein
MDCHECVLARSYLRALEKIERLTEIIKRLTPAEHSLIEAELADKWRTAILAWLLLLFLSTPGHAEFCYYKPNDPSVEKHPAHSRRQRKVDGQKCWYYARDELPKEDLIWLYDSREFDEEGKVTGRTLYPRVKDGGR